MDENQRSQVSRRDLIKTGIGALAGIALVFLTGTKTLAAENKLAKAAVQYEDVAKGKGEDCDDCIHFVPGKSPKASGTCEIVEGEINPHGHCIRFTMKPKK
jgi:hypothetical protein